MRRLLPLLAVLLLAPAPADAAAKRVVCGPAAAKTVGAGKSARVYRSGGRTWICAAGKRPVRVGRERPVLTRVAGTTVLFAGDDQARSVDARTGRTLRRLTTGDLGIQEAVLRRGGAFAVQAAGAIIKTDADWPHRQVLATDAAGSSLQSDPSGSRISWDLDTPAGAGFAYLADVVARCDAGTSQTDGGFTAGVLPTQVVMCPAGRPDRPRLILDGGSEASGPGDTTYSLLAFRAGTAVVDVSRADRLSEISGGLAVVRADRPARPVTFSGTGGPQAIERVLVDPAGRVVLGLRHSPAEPGSVHAVTDAGARELDAGPGVDAASVQLDGSVATWLRDGVAQTFDLASP